NSLFSFTIIYFSLPQPITAIEYATSPTHKTTLDYFIKKSCQLTLYSDLCYTSLSSSYTGDPNLGKLTYAAIQVSLAGCVHTANYVASLSHRTTTRADDMAVGDCVELTNEALTQVKRRLTEMAGILRSGVHRGGMSNVMTWMSAAITDQNTCMDGFNELNSGRDDEGVVRTKVGRKVDVVVKLISNALALVNSFADAITN
ncbi:Pectinesterase inhibitor 9, partial [Bienertia sinuspersici]